MIIIHHSFLLSFKGVRSYHQVHARGVKLIGATPDDLVIAGRDVEARVLAHAIKMFSEQRILLNDGKTVVFS